MTYMFGIYVLCAAVLRSLLLCSFVVSTDRPAGASSQPPSRPWRGHAGFGFPLLEAATLPA